ncbi:MAG TPA: sigma-54 dependent transcriptional regulator [Opitutus sp.]|nr:sigma-54 dependent transcriptional regulator [Opitutus sp.]
MEKVLIVEDDPVVGDVMREHFTRRKVLAQCVTSLAAAAEALEQDTYELVMLDIRLPDGDGQKFLERVTARPERPLVVMVTGHGTIESAVTCMRLGAFDYLLKPFSGSQIDVILRKADAHRQLLSVNRHLSDAGDEDGAMVGRSPAIMRLRQLIDRVAPTDATVLILGESGTGKEMIARELYRRSARRENPFIKVNCAAISETLIESEFFGHERGAYTGATGRREGRFELAHQGTLLLDEVSEIPPNLQPKLLRVLQEREFERVGGNRTIKVNVRLLATSNRDMLQHVEKGAFRQDLYYRLNVFPIHVPALRDRPEDIPLLAAHFLRRFARKHGVKVSGFSDVASRAMQAYRWPGNVRELHNVIERAVILSEPGLPVSAGALALPLDLDEIEPAAPDGVAEPEAVFVPAQQELIRPISELEKDAIGAALRRFDGNRTQAASALGISVRTLRNKLHEYRAAEECAGAGVASEVD